MGSQYNIERVSQTISMNTGASHASKRYQATRD